MGFLDQMKQTMQARKEAKRIQAEIDKISYTHQNGGISVTVKGDFSIGQIKFTDEALTEFRAGKTERFETLLKTVINVAVSNVRTQTQQVMQRMIKEGGFPGLPGAR